MAGAPRSPVDDLDRIAYLLERSGEPSYRVRAFRGAAAVIAGLDPEEVVRRAAAGSLRQLAGIGEATEKVVRESLSGERPGYLAKLEDGSAGRLGPPVAGAGDDGPRGEITPAGERIRSALLGDCHTHSDWSDGGSPIATMAEAAKDLGHEYMVLTDHSGRLKVAKGLDRERLLRQLDVVAEVNQAVAPFRILTGMEVDILEDGELDMGTEVLSRLDLVVGSVHSKLRMAERPMTVRMVRAVADPDLDILGHCTGRLVHERRRPESTFDAAAVFAACRRFDKAVEINSRPERLDPPRRLLRMAVEAGCRVSIDTDAHAPGQLEWLSFGCSRAAECDVPLDRIVNTWPAGRLLEWTTSHPHGF